MIVFPKLTIFNGSIDLGVRGVLSGTWEEHTSSGQRGSTSGWFGRAPGSDRDNLFHYGSYTTANTSEGRGFYFYFKITGASVDQYLYLTAEGNGITNTLGFTFSDNERQDRIFSNDDFDWRFGVDQFYSVQSLYSDSEFMGNRPSSWQATAGGIKFNSDMNTEGTEELKWRVFSRLEGETVGTQVFDTITIKIEDTSRIFYNKIDTDQFGNFSGTDSIETFAFPEFNSYDVMYKNFSQSRGMDRIWYENIPLFEVRNKSFSPFGQSPPPQSNYLSMVDYIKFKDKTIDVPKDVFGVFALLDASAPDALTAPPSQIFRLYNAAFARFPDYDGLKYWINDYKTQSIRDISANFIRSNEFISKYGQNNSTSEFVDNLYLNILGRLPDQSGKNYWVDSIDSGRESRSVVLLGFSESLENKSLFSYSTGLYP